MANRPARRKKSVTFSLPENFQTRRPPPTPPRFIPVARPRKSLEKKCKFPPGFNPFLTRFGEELCDVTLDCGHECLIPNCSKTAAAHTKSDCKETCLRNCSRGHPCLTQHPCSQPCGPCPVEIKVNFECGHSIKTPCSAPANFCTARCGKTLSCGHICPKPCSWPCEPCLAFCYDSFPCGHRFRVQCFVKDKVNRPCNRLVPSPVVPDCGHRILVPCVDKDMFTYSQLAILCTEPCANGNYNYGGCGHPCPGTCGGTCDNGIFHLRCQEPCGRINICGHICDTPCNKNCPPCQDKCQTTCEHGRCDNICGLPCAPCKQPCVWQCPHKKCNKLCSEVCDREPCDLPCPDLIKKCGHPCIGFCGETCPLLCRYCDCEKLMDGFMGIRSTIAEDDRFVLLKDCGHIFPVDILDQWMEILNENGEIHMKTCPLCRSIIWTCRRYNVILTQKREELIDIKIRVYGDLDKIEQIHVNIFREFAFTTYMRRFKEYTKWLLQHVSVENDKDGQPIFIIMDKGLAACLEYLANQLDRVETSFKRYAQEYEDDGFNLIEHYYRDMFYKIRSRGLPLTMTEMADLERQEKRILDMSQLLDRHSPKRGPGFLDINTTKGALLRYDTCYDILISRAPYTATLQKEFLDGLEALDSLIRCQLGVTESERQMIVKAFGTSIGRWFKCPNGHIYVVTECGGPTEVGVCNECGQSVGGENHRAVEGNALAVEMDGAHMPLYPTALTGLHMQQIVDVLNDALG